MSKNDSGLKNVPEELKGYVFYSHGSFSVKNDKNGLLITFGRFKLQEIAYAAVTLLIKHDWNILFVKDDPICEFNGIFWIFKVMNNKLIFDSKYDSFEKAVEYLEINSKCNDYHNDLLRKKKRKKKYADLTVDSYGDYEDSNIFPKGDNFIVRYKPRGKDYGVFNSIEEAIVAKQLLVKNDWRFSNSVEIEFYNSHYWVFKIEDNLLSFIDKFESYEDALDCSNSNKTEFNNQNNEQSLFGGVIRKIDDEYIEDIKKDDYVIENNYIKSIEDKFKIKSSKDKSPVRRPFRYIRETDDIPFDLEMLKEFKRENIKICEMEKNSEDKGLSIFANLNSQLNIVRFQENVLKDYYSITCLPNGEFDFSSNLYEFIEFKYIWNLLSCYEGDLNKISQLSSIHYFNDCYYIIKVFDNKLVISGSFVSYSDAEDNIEFLYDYYSKSVVDEYCSHNFEHYGNIFQLKENHNGKLFEMEGFKSLEELKAVADIFDMNGWDPKVFKHYDIFHYHGFYWVIDYFFYYVKLEGRFYSEEDAVNHVSKI